MQNAKVDRNLLVWLVATFFLVTVSLAEAQQAKKVARIGYLGNEKSTASEEVFLQVEGLFWNIEVEDSSIPCFFSRLHCSDGCL